MSGLLDLKALSAAKDKLSKTETKDMSAPHILNKEGILEIAEHQNVVQGVNIEEWEENLKDITFQTRYLPLTVEEATAFLHITECYNSKSIIKPTPTADDSALIQQVTSKLQAIIDKEPGWKEKGVFVKTSSRSAKDAAIAHEKLVSCYREHCRKISSPPYPINDRLKSLLHSATRMLLCEDAKAAISMLTQSERIEQDMRLALEVYERNKSWNEHLVVREWHDIDVGQEWRCFIYNRKVTAITQYNCVPFFADLVENKDYLENTIVKFLNEVVLPKLPESKFKDMIIDVALTGDIYNKPTVWVIELNPYLWSTGAALFNWKDDIAVLKGEKPFEFRIQTEEADEMKVKSTISHVWRSALESTEL